MINLKKYYAFQRKKLRLAQENFRNSVYKLKSRIEECPQNTKILFDSFFEKKNY